MLPSQEVFKEYCKLKNEESVSLNRTDLPNEFCEKSYEIIVDFIQKSRNLDYEWSLYFDYTTGEILRCGKGGTQNVILEFDDDEFEDNNVASIHNHPKDCISAPSYKNFGILKRNFEDYELIAGYDAFWILKVKGTYNELVNPFKIFSIYASKVSLGHCLRRYGYGKITDKMHNVYYGNQLLKYINNNNISNIQLTKKEYVIMESNKNIAVYDCGERMPEPNVLEYLKELFDNPLMPSPTDLMYAAYQKAGIDVDYDDIFPEELFIGE